VKKTYEGGEIKVRFFNNTERDEIIKKGGRGKGSSKKTCTNFTKEIFLGTGVTGTNGDGKNESQNGLKVLGYLKRSCMAPTVCSCLFER